MPTLSETRFLTPAEKRQEIADFAAWRRPGNYRTDHPEAKGGEGWIDPEVLPLVDELNMLPGVLTLQSCCGHVNGHEYSYPGELWLRLDIPTMGRFERELDLLLRHDVIQHITKLYSLQEGRAPYEVVSIKFWGEPVGRMAEAREVIAGFFQECAR